MPIDFTPSSEQAALRNGARAFAEAVLRDVKPAIDRHPAPEARFYATKPFYAAMNDAGFTRAFVPKPLGGTGLSTLDCAIAAEEMTRVDVNVPTTFLSVGLGLQPLLRFGTPEQQRRFLPDFLADGMRLASLASTEEEGSANADSPDPSAGVRTVARREGDEWVISGAKAYTTNACGWDGRGAHLLAVVCRTDLSAPPGQSLAVILVPGTLPGISFPSFIDTAGHRATVSPRVVFDNVRVPAANIVGAPGDGLAIVATSFSWSGALVGAACVGVMRAAFDAAYDYARTEKRLGAEPIIAHQNVGFMLSDIRTRIEACRYLTWKACHQFDLSDGRSQEASQMAKIFCSEQAVQVVYDAMRLVGVDAYSDMYPLAALMQDALAFPLYDGGNLGVRRRALHTLMAAPGYDAMACAEARF